MVFLRFASMAHFDTYSEDLPGESENVLYISGISIEWNRLWIEPYRLFSLMTVFLIEIYQTISVVTWQYS